MSMSTGEIQEEILDQEWQSLLHTAREIGLTPEEVRAFFLQATTNR